ncbi:LPS assembly lipoprotein LptE [Lacipirellula parvula]|uniref:LPS-assembly lipoprotein LptE n=1 Tax=Lacipirellula parvula TaxID=2650471 RepID=A0A5K7X5D8_9BACT|nr:LPS assembly lipoprotein LptE [Lacipirellula parvula]BBO31740.1 hypothetical protein PLANPX_1352 [Lacipirellula parvula]
MLRPSAAKLLFALGLLGLATPGCAAYRVGNETLYAPDVTTVYVPMIESDSFRRDLGERLTEAVIKEIELKTPYKVVGTPDADSVLVAKLQGERKLLEFENQNDDPRALEYALTANVTWLNRRRQPLAPMNAIPLPADLVSITQTATMLPEPGQSDASAQQQAIQRLAEQIVATMEEPW